MERNLLEKELENSLSTPAVEPTDGVKIPTGFYYVGGTKASGIVISDNKNDKNKYRNQKVVGTDLLGNQYVWIPCTTAVQAQIFNMQEPNGELSRWR